MSSHSLFSKSDLWSFRLYRDFQESFQNLNIMPGCFFYRSIFVETMVMQVKYVVHMHVQRLARAPALPWPPFHARARET